MIFFVLCFSFFFFKQKTAYEMRISDWSSDVCSSDLLVVGGFVSGPITDTVRARLAMRSETMDGWQQSLSRPGDTLGNKRFFTGRLLVDWDATEKLRFELHASMPNDGSESPRPDERRVGQEWVRPCRTRWSTNH